MRALGAALAVASIWAAILTAADPAPAWVAQVAASGGGGCGSIAFDNAADLGNNGGSGTLTTGNYTAPSGTCPMLVLAIAGDQTADDITSVKYGGTDMTFAVKKVDPGAFERIVYLYYLLAPASGAHTFVVTTSGSHYLFAAAAGYNGVQQSAQPDATATNISSGSVSTLTTTSLTTITDNDWAILVEAGYNGNLCPTAGTGLTRRACDGVFGVFGLFDSNGVIHPAGSTSFTTNRSGNSDRITHAVAAFIP